MKLTKSLYEKVLSISTFCLLLLECDLSWGLELNRTKPWTRLQL